jgi:hypothetical protein
VSGELVTFHTNLPKGVGVKGMAAFLQPILRNMRVRWLTIFGDGRVEVRITPRATDLPPAEDLPVQRSLMDRARSSTAHEVPFQGTMAATILLAYRHAARMGLYPVCWAADRVLTGSDEVPLHPLHQTKHVFAGIPLYVEDTEGSLLLFAGASDDGLDDVEHVFRIQYPGGLDVRQ